MKKDELKFSFVSSLVVFGTLGFLISPSLGLSSGPETQAVSGTRDNVFPPPDARILQRGSSAVPVPAPVLAENANLPQNNEPRNNPPVARSPNPLPGANAYNPPTPTSGSGFGSKSATKAQKRNYRKFGNEGHIEELIRAAEDSEYIAFLKEQKETEQIASRNAVEQSAARKKEFEADENARLAYIAVRNGIVKKSKIQDFIEHEKEKILEWKQNEVARKELVQVRRDEKAKKRAEFRKNFQVYLASHQNDFEGTLLTEKQATDSASGLITAQKPTLAPGPNVRTPANSEATNLNGSGASPQLRYDRKPSFPTSAPTPSSPFSKPGGPPLGTARPVPSVLGR